MVNCLGANIDGKFVHNGIRIKSVKSELSVSTFMVMQEYKYWNKRLADKVNIELINIDGEILSTHSMYLSFVGIEQDEFKRLMITLYFHY